VRTESNLVVEDEPEAMSLVVDQLSELGYSVPTAQDALQALEILRKEGQIDVPFSNVVMPDGMDGAQLAVEARRIAPGLKILLTSGYTAAAL
jgi:CheY-like chemotaxis protein